MRKLKCSPADHYTPTDTQREFMGALPRRTHHVHQPTMRRGKSFAIPELLTRMARTDGFFKLKGDA